MADACTEGVDTGFVALGYFKVAILGVVQGISELMPISSTAHMRLVPAVLGWQDPGSAFSAAMQMAALAAVISYFWADLRWLATDSLSAARHGRFRDKSFQFVMWIVVSCGNGDRKRWRAEWDLGRSKPLDGRHRPTALGAKPEITSSDYGSFLLGLWSQG